MPCKMRKHFIRRRTPAACSIGDSVFGKKSPKLCICPDCNATGCYDKVFRGLGFDMSKVCKSCNGRGHRVLKAGETEGVMGINHAAVG